MCCEMGVSIDAVEVWDSTDVSSRGKRSGGGSGGTAGGNISLASGWVGMMWSISSGIVSTIGTLCWFPNGAAGGSSSFRDDGNVTPRGWVRAGVVGYGLYKILFSCCPLENPVCRYLHQRENRRK